MKSVWMPPTLRLIKGFFNRVEGDEFDGVYGSFPRRELEMISEINASVGKEHNFEYVKVSKSFFPNDLDIKESEIPVRMAIHFDENEMTNLRTNKIILAYSDDT